MNARRTRAALAVVGLGISSVAGTVSCFNSHVFDIIDSCQVAQESIQVPIQPTNAADILIVVDNSGSMCEEQANLVENFFNDQQTNGTFECPLADPALRDEERFKNPLESVVNSELAECGFIQILSAYDNDFRVGVITTDVGPCDNRFGIADDPNQATHPNNCKQMAQVGWNRKPQRGCLQAPVAWEQKFLTPETENIGEQFASLLDNVQTFGSGFERGLDAMRIFLDPNSDRHESCASDRDDFIRQDASLLIIFLTDEDDCSHEDIAAFPDENAAEGCEGNETFPETRDPPVSSAFCYDKVGSLTPVSAYSQFLQNYKGNTGDVRIAVIAGGVFDAENSTVAQGCRVVDGAPSGLCTPSRGTSNYTIGGALCDPANLDAQGLPACCEADPGSRYYSLAEDIGANNAFTDSICFASFRDTMRELAQFAAKVESYTLDEPPQIPEALQVEIIRSGSGGVATPINRIPDDDPDPEGGDGWFLEEDRRTIRFYGSATPQPGDDIRIFVLRETSEDTGGNRCVGFSSE